MLHVANLMPVQFKFSQPISPHKGKTIPFGDYNEQNSLAGSDT